MRRNIDWRLFLVIIGLVFALLMFLSPLYADDFADVFYLNSGYRIHSFREFCANLHYHYFHKSGRFLPLLFDQIFGVLCGKTVFNIVNSVMFVVFLLLLTQQAGDSLNVGLTSALLFSLMPGFNLAFLWMAGACNYLWSAVLLLLLIKAMGSEKTQSPLLCFFFGLICGWTNEALVIGLAAGYIVYYCCHWKFLTAPKIALLSGFFLGILLLVLSPSSINRFMGGMESHVTLASFGHRIISSLLAMKSLRILPFLVIVLLFFSFRKGFLLPFLKENLVFVVAIGVSFLFILVTNHTSAHSRFGIEFFSLILLLRLVVPALSASRHASAVRLLCYLILAGILLPTIYYSFLNHNEFKRCVTQIQQPDSFIIETNETSMPLFFNRLVLRFMPSENNDYYHGYLGDAWIEQYYGKDELCFLPKRFLDAVSQDPTSFQEFDILTDLPFYAKLANPSETINHISFILSPKDKKTVPLVLRPFINKMEQYSSKEIKTDKYRLITLPHGESFLFIGKKHLVMDRVSAISVL
jgi:hypothetical protein